MPLIQVIVLGLVQGATEFLPVSSSAHLYLVSLYAGWPDQGLTFDVALHLGTLVAILIYFLRTWVDMVFNNRRMLGLLIVGTIPGAIIGKLFEKSIESTFRNPYVIGVDFIVIGLVMWWAESVSRQTRDLNSVNMLDAIAIGCGRGARGVPRRVALGDHHQRRIIPRVRPRVGGAIFVSCWRRL